MILPKEKKYLVKINIRWLNDDFAYLNYLERKNRVMLHDKDDYEIYKTSFTKQELQFIQPIREFLEDMEGKYELIEVADNEID